MEILTKIKNKTDFGLALAFLISVTLIPALNLPLSGATTSYLSFSDYGFIIGVMIIAFGYFRTILETSMHDKIAKILIGLI